MWHAGNKLVLATVGGSPTQASEVALLAVDSVDQLLSAESSQWETLRKSSKVEVRQDDPWFPCHCQTSSAFPGSSLPGLAIPNMLSGSYSS